MSSITPSATRKSASLARLQVGGHGVLHQGRHYLIGTDDGADFPYTAIPGTDFVGMVVNSLAGSALVVIDTCYAGATASDAVRSLVELGGTSSTGGGGTWVLAAAQSTERAWRGAMAGALADVVTESSAGKRQRYLSMEQVTEGINRYFDTHVIFSRTPTAWSIRVLPGPSGCMRCG